MSRKKLKEEQKKISIGVSIDKDILELFDKQLDGKKRSKYIENLIREDMKNRGKDIEPNF